MCDFQPEFDIIILDKKSLKSKLYKVIFTKKLEYIYKLRLKITYFLLIFLKLDF